MHFLRSRDGTTEYFMKYLVDIAPRTIGMLRSDGVGEGVEGEFGAPLLEKIRSRSLRLSIPLN